MRRSRYYQLSREINKARADKTSPVHTNNNIDATTCGIPGESRSPQNVTSDRFGQILLRLAEVKYLAFQLESFLLSRFWAGGIPKESLLTEMLLTKRSRPSGHPSTGTLLPRPFESIVPITASTSCQPSNTSSVNFRSSGSYRITSHGTCFEALDDITRSINQGGDLFEPKLEPVNPLSRQSHKTHSLQAPPSTGDCDYVHSPGSITSLHQSPIPTSQMKSHQHNCQSPISGFGAGEFWATPPTVYYDTTAFLEHNELLNSGKDENEEQPEGGTDNCVDQRDQASRSTTSDLSTNLESSQIQVPPGSVQTASIGFDLFAKVHAEQRQMQRISDIKDQTSKSKAPNTQTRPHQINLADFEAGSTHVWRPAPICIVDENEGLVVQAIDGNEQGQGRQENSSPLLTHGLVLKTEPHEELTSSGTKTHWSADNHCSSEFSRLVELEVGAESSNVSTDLLLSEVSASSPAVAVVNHATNNSVVAYHLASPVAFRPQYSIQLPTDQSASFTIKQED
ncbi:unnamed protein product [Protopolystoma xenopodis]|uniref:Uncharacterized protein n=1 Tax=Protopolystoma xenopodis TaxID=117903 RepID=A0A3S4ZY49_9PLAT|nr:unnamed protein product [Protopolystoma xenopodis]